MQVEQVRVRKSSWWQIKVMSLESIFMSRFTSENSLARVPWYFPEFT